MQLAQRDNMMRHTMNTIFRLAILLTTLCGATCALADDRTGDLLEPESVTLFLKDNCVRCHGATKNKRDISFQALKVGDLADADAQLLTRMLSVLERGEMPPEDEPQPKPAEKQAVARFIRAALRDLDLRAQNRLAQTKDDPNAAPATRRLTNVEYQNTMRDLLGFELKLADRLPKDPTKPYRFNNTAAMLQMSPELLESYLACARQVMASAIVSPDKPITKKTRSDWKADSAQPDRLPTREISIWSSGRGSAAMGMTIKDFPKTGEFRVRFAASAILTDDVQEVPLRLLMGQPINSTNSSTLLVEPLGTVRLHNSPDAPQIYEFRGRIENCPLHKKPGKGKGKESTGGEDFLTITPQNLYDDGTLNDNYGSQQSRLTSMPRVALDWMEFEAPLTDVWPPEHHTQILFDSPLKTSDPVAYVRVVLQRFMSRAYRRPATAAEVDRFAKIYASLLPELQTVEATMRETLSLVLISPQFLYHTIDRGPKAEFRQYELASRLSYFLWESMPDETLLAVAAQGKLDAPQVLRQQVERLLADQRCQDFIRNFSMQWLSLAKMRTVPINHDLFPRFLYYVPVGERAGTEVPYRPTIRDYMLDETTAFVAELIKTNASVTSLVDSDFACLNQPLAAHYGVPDVQGDEIRVVPLKPEYHLGGLLTQGSVLIGNGTGTAPHPIYRAVWLREAILGEDVPAPPADVPALSDSAGAAAEKALTIKDLLIKHRQKESCNDCHSRLDPWGIPFEQYNAIGKFQPLVPKDGAHVAPMSAKVHTDFAGYQHYLTTINTVPVSADSRLPRGPNVRGLDDLKAYLLEHRKTDIAKNVARRFLSYGVGRDLSWRDQPLLEALVAKSSADGYRLRDLIVLVCQSPAFLKP